MDLRSPVLDRSLCASAVCTHRRNSILGSQREMREARARELPRQRIPQGAQMPAQHEGERWRERPRPRYGETIGWRSRRFGIRKCLE